MHFAYLINFFQMGRESMESVSAGARFPSVSAPESQEGMPQEGDTSSTKATSLNLKIFVYSCIVDLTVGFAYLHHAAGFAYLHERKYFLCIPVIVEKQQH